MSEKSYVPLALTMGHLIWYCDFSILVRENHSVKLKLFSFHTMHFMLENFGHLHILK